MPFLFSLPSAALTLDIIVEEADSAPMEDGALPCVLSLSVRDGNPHYTTAGGYVLVWFRDGDAFPLVPWERATVRTAPAGSYDAALTLEGGVIDICLDIAGVADCSPRVLALPRYLGTPHHVNHYHVAPPPYTHDSPFLSKGLSR